MFREATGDCGFYIVQELYVTPKLISCLEIRTNNCKLRGFKHILLSYRYSKSSDLAPSFANLLVVYFGSYG